MKPLHPIARISTQSQQPPTVESIYENDQEETDDEAEAIADALLGRRTQTRLSIGKFIDSSPSRASYLEEGQLPEDDLSHPDSSLNSLPTSIAHQDHLTSSSSAPQQPPSSLLDRLGPPSQPASLTSSNSPQDDRSKRTIQIHIPEDSKIQPRNTRTHRQPAHSPKRTRNSRSRSPNRQPPQSANEQRRTSLSSRITLSNRHHSCSPIALQFDVQSRCQQIARRFSSPSNSIPVRRDPREQREPSAARNEPNPNSHRPHHHPSHSNNGPPTFQSKASNSNAIALPTNKSPTSKNSALRVSILIENLPPYSALTPRRLYDHLANLLPPTQRSEASLPSGLKLYRYARSDCVCAELRFNALAHARHFAQKAIRAWPSIWYTASKIPPEFRKKSMEFTVLDEDKPVTWPSRCETYYPKSKSNLHRPHTRTVEEDTTIIPTIAEKDASSTSSQTRPAPIPEFGRRKQAQTNPSSAPSTSKPTKLTNTSATKSHQSDCLGHTRGCPTESEDTAPAKKKTRPPVLEARSLEESHELIKNEISILLSQSSNTSTSIPPKDTNVPVLGNPPKDTHLPMIKHSPKDTIPSPVDQPTNDALVTASQAALAFSSTLADDQHQPPFTSIINVAVATSGPSQIPGLNVGAGQHGNPSPALTLHSASSKSPDSSHTKFPHPVFTLESIQRDSKDRNNGVLLSKMLPSITLSVLQSHFLIPNRPRDFRIFEPLQICYGPFFSPPPLDQTIPSSSSANHSFNHQLEMGCLITFSDPNTAAHFFRVLELNSPFHPLHIRLVDPAQIEFLPSASTISNPPKQQGYLDPSGTCYGLASPFFANSGFLSWPTVQHEMMQSSSPLGIGPMSQLGEPHPPSGPIHHHQPAEMVYNNNNNAYPYLNDYSSSLIGHHMPSHPSPSPLSFPSSLSYNHSPFSVPPPPPVVSDPSQDLSSLLSSSSSPCQTFSSHQLPPISPSQPLTTLHQPPSSLHHQDFSQHLPPLPPCNPQPSPPPPTSSALEFSTSPDPSPSASTSVDSLEILTFIPNPSSFDPCLHPNSNSNSHFTVNPNSNSYSYVNTNLTLNFSANANSNLAHSNPALINPDKLGTSTTNETTTKKTSSPPPNSTIDIPKTDHSSTAMISTSSSNSSNTQLEHLERLKKILKARKAVGL